ncbi:recombination mediator RecR [Methylicorpusculum sp.]|uniref:recombination mediator RecR n=1 Tax=Methylicorpusculum sp. TaxID=2713644 RepID=UPI00271A634F|nr:recombination mediator RecR [Methylicorpusculum sp.]MDO8846412.1 recombination mediator RecR [Methylicorpusculum sp.]MDP2180180.1 recombination mediator RecR [Methylicorpusculum sp.]MDP3530735.1 recombination mediator RecR [Methylicorpusculum sp.]MDZ4154507.1 recombination mediator RecR [Methylicorpusculum sp.]
MDKKGLLGQLIQDLCYLPGVGPKSAQRMAFYLLQRNRDGAKRLAETLLESLNKVTRCKSCRNLTDQMICSICSNQGRDHSVVCIVETPADVWAVDQASVFGGVFFVLHGHLSPLDGIGPDELGLDLLEQRLENKEIKEIILATNSTVEGEATAQLISEIAKRSHVRASRIAHGVPMGGELEYIDSSTLTHAFKGRKPI